MPLKDFEIIAKLGEGTYSTVYKALRHQDGLLYALKRVKVRQLQPKETDNALNEIRILASIHHPNVIAYKEAFFDEPTMSLCIVMEFAEDGDLASKIASHHQKNLPLPEETIWSWLTQAVKGLNQLHALQITHRDIKPANLFLAGDGNIKLGDMNVSKVAQEGLCATRAGTPYYASPEVWKDLPYGEKSDIWSLGCVIYELISFRPPFQAEDVEGLCKKVVRGIYSKLPPEYSQDLSSMVRLMLQVNPELRPSCEKILKTITLKRNNKFIGDMELSKQLLLRTIKAEQNFQSLKSQLPKPNYVPSKEKREKGVRSEVDDLQERKREFRHQQTEVEYLPLLENHKRNLYMRKVSDRAVSNKNSLEEVSRNRKKSEISDIRPVLAASGEDHPGCVRELKLPRVQNRPNRIRDKISKQSSLRVYRLIDS